MKAIAEMPIEIDVRSEIGELEGVIIHAPGREVEDMTPRNAERALYSDILNLAVASVEYSQFSTVLRKLTRTFEVQTLLRETLQDESAKNELLKKICRNEAVDCIKEYLGLLEPAELARQLIEGVPLKKETLTNFLSNERYSMQPLHNFFFTRDASISIDNQVLIARMASKVREREAIIMETIFDHHPHFRATTFNPADSQPFDPGITIEGGDILVAREDILLVGIGARTTTQGVDYLLERLKHKGRRQNIIVQELPPSPESFIHLDMVFTFLDVDTCMMYQPVVLDPNRYKTVHIALDNGRVDFIREKRNIPEALQKLGMDLNQVLCGGETDEWIQEREQWHSGANFFAVAPGKVMGYGRNVHTMEALNRKGYEIIRAVDFLKGKVDLSGYSRYVITIDGSELARGGGGCRCMTMPVRRKPVAV